MTGQFEIGERVRVHGAGLVPADTYGTIHEVLLDAQDLYYVWFDGWADPHLMHARDLESADDVLPDRERVVGAD